MSHRWKLVIAIAVVMLAMMGIWVMTMHLTADSDVDVYRKSLIAKGEKLEIAEVMPAPVPAEQNGADVLNQAFRLFVSAYDPSNLPPAMLMVAPGKAAVCFQQSVARGSDFTNSWSNMMDVVEADRPATELLKEAMNYPAIDFHRDYNKGPETLLPELAPLKRSVQRLSAEAMCDLHNGETGSAVTNICVMLALVKEEQNDPMFISQLVRIAMAAIAASPTWELLQSTNVNDAELAMVQTNWESLEYFHGIENALLMGRAMNEVTIKKMRQSNEYFNHVLPISSMDFWRNARLAGTKIMWRASWTYSDELRMLEDDEIILQCVRNMETNSCINLVYSNMVNQIQDSVGTNQWDDLMDNVDVAGLRRLFSAGSVSSGSIMHRAIVAEVNRRTVITAIALKRYQLKEGGYPTNLSALVPEFLPSVPLDPMDGKPLRYRAKTDGTFVLYSIGDDGTDDGGDPSLPSGYIGGNLYWLGPHALDWVWPQPATKAEIEHFYAHPPK